MKTERKWIVMALVFALAFGVAGMGSVYAEEDDSAAVVAMTDFPDDIATVDGTVSAGSDEHCHDICGAFTVAYLCPSKVPFSVCKCVWFGDNCVKA